MNPIKASTTVKCDEEKVKKEKRYYYIAKSISRLDHPYTSKADYLAFLPLGLKGIRNK